MKKYKGEILIVLGCILIIGITVTFAYFLANIEGEGKSIILKSKNLKITFTESNNLSGENISPGWSKTSTFIVKNEGDKDYTYNIVIKDLINTFVTTGNLQYKITSTDGGYNMTDFKDIPKSSTANNKIIATNITISGNTSQTYTVLFTYNNSDDNQIDDMGKTLSGQIIVDEYIIPTLAERLSEDNPTRLERTDFSITFNETNIGILYMSTESIAEGVDQNVYYFSGNAKNNWVKFAGFYWRIIRTNADGSVRMLYSGTSPSATAGYINSTSTALNDTVNNPMYVGYMYGNPDGTTFDEVHTNTTSSAIKTTVDNWYKTNIVDKGYSGYVSNAVGFCGDRTIYSGGDGVQTDKNTYFGAYGRHSKQTAQFTCPEPSRDLYTTTDSSIGNKALTYPVGLITYDELVFAGMDNRHINKLSWAYSIQHYWTMSPSFFNAASGIAGEWSQDSAGYLSRWWGVNVSLGARPVINLKSDTLITGGIGTSSEPYVIAE